MEPPGLLSGRFSANQLPGATLLQFQSLDPPADKHLTLRARESGLGNGPTLFQPPAVHSTSVGRYLHGTAPRKAVCAVSIKFQRATSPAEVPRARTAKPTDRIPSRLENLVDGRDGGKKKEVGKGKGKRLLAPGRRIPGAASSRPALQSAATAAKRPQCPVGAWPLDPPLAFLAPWLPWLSPAQEQLSKSNPSPKRLHFLPHRHRSIITTTLYAR